MVLVGMITWTVPAIHHWAGSYRYSTSTSAQIELWLQFRLWNRSCRISAQAHLNYTYIYCGEGVCGDYDLSKCIFYEDEVLLRVASTVSFTSKISI